MPCPLFLPASPLNGFTANALPLGDLYGGECAALSGTLIPLDTIRACCNHGYARERCDRAAQTAVDAARFLVRSHQGDTIEIAWSTEANHHPVAVGTITLKLSEPAGAEPLAIQARACAASYLRRTGRG